MHHSVPVKSQRIGFPVEHAVCNARSIESCNHHVCNVPKKTSQMSCGLVSSITQMESNFELISRAGILVDSRARGAWSLAEQRPTRIKKRQAKLLSVICFGRCCPFRQRWLFPLHITELSSVSFWAWCAYRRNWWCSRSFC